jgi:hypothetical protein
MIRRPTPITIPAIAPELIPCFAVVMIDREGSADDAPRTAVDDDDAIVSVPIADDRDHEDATA